MPFSVCFARDFAQLMGIYPDSPESSNSPNLAGIKNNTRAIFFSLVSSDSYAVGIVGSVGIVGIYPESSDSPDSTDSPDSPKPRGY